MGSEGEDGGVELDERLVPYQSIAVADELVRKYGLELVENPKIVKLD